MYPCFQAQTSATFVPPPLDGQLTIPQIYDHHFYNSPNHPLFLYDHDAQVHTITWQQAGRAIHTAARTLTLVPTLHESKDAPVVAILAVIDQLSYFALTAGIMRAGYRAFPISPRNSARGVANLLQKMQVHHLIVSKDEGVQKTAKAACELVKEEGNPIDVALLTAPTFDNLYTNNDRNFIPLPPMGNGNANDIALVLHSSGSTSFPKPIPLTHNNLIQWGKQPYYGETDICGRVLSNHSLPFFHAMGVVSLTWATMCGVTISNFAPRVPPVVTTSENLFKSAVTCRSRLIFCVPTFLEEWSQSQEKLAELKKYEAIMFGGAPIQKAVGDMLSGLGIHLYPFYGATELGGTSAFLPKAPPAEGWEYFKISSHSEPVFIDQGIQEGVYQLIIKTTPTHTPAVTNDIQDGVNAYDTNDLVIRHPNNPTLMKIYGRADDQIMHSTGEKTNPVPMETIINRHPMVQSSVMFGRGRFQAGVLIDPKPEYAFDPNDYEKLAAFRDAIWPNIQDANNFGPSHSRIFKEIILVAKPSMPFQYTPKGTPRRQVIINEYEEEINQGYIDLENSSSIEVSVSFTLATMEPYISQLVDQVMGGELKKEDDFFLCGCDSLKATWIRNNILNILRSGNVDTSNIPVNFVYLYPTIGRLCKYLTSIVSGHTIDSTKETAERMDALVEKYSQDFIKHNPITTKAKEHPTREIVLLTGSTGGLGSYVLEHLILDDKVEKIYCFNRKGRTASLDRQKDAFRERGIEVELLDSNSDKVVFVDGQSDGRYLGLSEAMYKEIRDSITSVMHIAWRVDFNVSISSMEPLIAGTRALIDLCLSSPQIQPPRIVFASSIGVVRNWKDGFAPESALPEASIAIGSGYPESKWVAEQILYRASQSETSFHPVIVRIGQLCGGRNGYWSATEWVPGVVRTARALKCLPDAPGCVSWVPVHMAAIAFADMRFSPSIFLHLVHPNPIKWTYLFQSVAQSLNVSLLPYAQWLELLEKSAEDINIDIPASSLQLLDYYQSANKIEVSEDDEAFGFPRLSTVCAESATPVLSNLEELGKKDVEGWLSYWSSIEAL